MSQDHSSRPAVREAAQSAASAGECGCEQQMMQDIAAIMRAAQPHGMLGWQRRFVSDASHELCTPIAGLRARLEEARLHPGETDLETLLVGALGDVYRLQAIVADLLVLARPEAHAAGRWEPTDLAELVQDVLSRRVDRREVILRLDSGVIVNVARCDISRLFGNLLDNAQRHAVDTVHVEVRRSGDTAELVVADDGAGIAGTDREQIFEVFTRLDASRCRRYGGPGLGLAIARGLAWAHHGTLRVEDSLLGACFVLRLPLANLGSSLRFGPPEPEPQ
ncbi:sensor histidine kinase [Nonomuraea sp. NPDC050451]|uniref:sensor histidine kinase n=1 Tax=Nonomuraea sp. NPDC050451 TaxID=3364364 RepID=UPI003796D541